MKKTVRPSPVAVLLFGFFTVICTAGAVAAAIDGGSFPAEIMFPLLILAGVFVFYLLKYLAQSKIEFDEDSFTVDGKTYSYDEITEVTVDSEQVLRNMSTLRITLYIGEEKICDFTKSDSGAKQFIALLQRHGASVSIDI